MMEFEKKVLLSQREYHFLLNRKQDAPPRIVQINHYYDTDDFAWNRLGITCRVRERKGRFEATIKAHRSGAGECSIETSRPADNERDARLFDAMGVHLQGYLTTYRTQLAHWKGLDIVLDENAYLGRTDYELEIEYDALRAAQADLALHSIAFDLHRHHLIEDQEEWCQRAQAVQSKSERFFARKAKLQHAGGAAI